MRNLPTYTRYNGETKIALWDNSSIEFMHRMDYHGHNTVQLLTDYDAIFIPAWVFIEVKVSIYRLQYIDKLLEAGLGIYVIAEETYVHLLKQQDIHLLDIVDASVSCIPEIKRYLRQSVMKEDPLDLEPPEEWIRGLYANWPISGRITASGRVKKKNAGEISLTILTEIFSWYYPDS